MIRIVIYILFICSSTVCFSQNEKAFDLYSAGVRAAYAYDYGLAIHCYSDAIKLKPDYMMAYYNRGALFAKTKEYDNAIVDMHQVLQLDSTYYDAYIILGEVYIGKSDIATATKMYETVLKKIPTYKKGLQGMAMCLFYLRKYDESISYFTKYIAQAKNDEDAYYKRGLAYFSMDNFQMAIQDYTQSIQINEKYKQAYEARATAYRFIANLPKACDDWNKAVELGSKEAMKNIETYCTK